MILGKRHPRVRFWLSHMEFYMHFMDYTPIDWLDVFVMRVEGATSTWVNAVLQDVVVGRKPMFHTWTQFKEAMV